MRLRVLVALAAIGLPMPLLADTGYSYTGNNFTTTIAVLGDVYSTSDSVTGWFTVSSPLGDNFNGVVAPTSYSFSDGVNTWNSGNSWDYSFDVMTNASGDITNWYINVGNPVVELAGILSDGSVGDYASDFLGGSASNYDPGTWSAPYSVGATPEPGSLVLLGTGLLGVGGTLRRRIRRA